MKQVLIRPIISEKSMLEAQKNRYTFEVDKSASKNQIRDAVVEIYQVEVLGVRTAKMPGKRKRTGRLRRQIKKTDSKKAIVEIKQGQKIPIFETQG